MDTKTRLRSNLPAVVHASLLPVILIALLLAACASQAGTDSPLMQATATTTVVLSTATPQFDIPSPTAQAAPTEVPAPTALPIATSRGPNLEATDPSTVSLASGQLQLVEFFRFT